MKNELGHLQEKASRLPEGWSDPEVVEDTVVADGIELRRAGLSSTGPEGEELTGSAVEADTSPLARSYYELLERVSTLEQLRDRRASYELRTLDGEPMGACAADDVFLESDAPARWRYARSNGVALHTNWRNAALRAFCELAERDRVLRAWYGEILPRRLAFTPAATPLENAQSYEWLAYAFPEKVPSPGFSHGVHVAGVFGFPTCAEAPLVMGYGGRLDPSEAVDAAVREAMQTLAFLWGEPLLEAPPHPAPTPMHHLEYFQCRRHHAILRSWLDGSHARYREREWDTGRARTRSGSSRHVRGPAATSSPGISLVDLTPAWLGGGLRVAKAVCATAAPLAFGEIPFTAHLPPELRVHPIA